MNYIVKILTDFRQKIPSWKVDIVCASNVSNLTIPRKTKISGHFRLNARKISENPLHKSLIF